MRDWSLAERLLERYLREARDADLRWEAWQQLLVVLNAAGQEPRGREKGYSFWFSFLLCLLGQLIGLLAVLLLPDIARIRADAVGRDRAQDQEIATLKARLAVLESGSGTPAGTRVESPPAAPAVFPARTDEVIACPRCGRRQKGNRDSCYACGLPFRLA